MPNIMTVEEAEYQACWAEYNIIRADFHAGKVDRHEFIQAKNKMEAAMRDFERSTT